MKMQEPKPISAEPAVPRMTRMLLTIASYASIAFLPTAPPRIPSPVVRLDGVVFVDANGNGVRDANETGLRGVMVSNQDTVAVTDASGAFQLPAGSSGIVFVSVPDRYRAIGSFWRAVDTTTNAPAPLTFGLQPVRAARDFSFVHASDTHLAPANVDRIRRARAMIDSVRPAFALFAGDLVRDAMSTPESISVKYFELFRDEARQFKTPLWLVPGNHDHFGIIRPRSGVKETHPLYGRRIYRKYFGPDYYSFTSGGVHFIALNTLQMDDSAYYGRVDSVQLAWLARDVANVPAAMPIVTFNHIPLVSAWEMFTGYIDMAYVSSVAHVNGQTVMRHTVSNTIDVIAAMHGHRYVLGLGAHTHAGERLSFWTGGMSIRFEQSPAVVGSAEFGPLTIRSGFTVYSVHDGNIDAGRYVSLDAEPPARSR